MKVKQLRIALIAVVLAVAPVGLGAQAAGTANQGAGKIGGPAAQGHVLRILSPRMGERLTQDFVDVEFELANSGVSAAGTPNFQVQLDQRDPVNTSSTSHTFTGLKPGPHTLTVQLVDANGTPVMGARGQTQFVVVQPGPTPGAAILLEHRPPSTVLAALRVEEASARAAVKERSLASAAGALPLLSVIGFGVLLGGIASAMKTRPK